MDEVEVVLVALLVAVAVLGGGRARDQRPVPDRARDRRRWCSGFVPGLPDVELDPDLVLVIFLPPLLYSAAFFANLRDLRRDLRPISLLSIGLVLVDDVRRSRSSRTR